MEFQRMSFPNCSGIVYFLSYRGSPIGPDIPFYVGQSDHHVGRLGDYLAANLTAPTDFKVGKGARYLSEHGFSVHFHYAVAENRMEEEKKLIVMFENEGHILLNRWQIPANAFRSYDRALAAVHTFVEESILGHNAGSPMSRRAMGTLDPAGAQER